MALDFPDSPNDGQVFSGFTWDNTAGLWRVRGNALSPAGVSGVTGTVATTTDGNDTIYSFTDDGTITIATGGIANILLVGGGGGGGSVNNSSSGGGGAGQVLAINNLYLQAGTSSIHVGSGGAGGNTLPPTIGEYSQLGNILAMGGGGGGTRDSAGSVHAPSRGANGGGGAGNYAWAITGATSFFDFGFSGGNGTSGTDNGAGGAGAGQVGGNGAASTAGNGGNGVQSSITGTSTYYGGGGGGSSYSASAGTGGLGGGASAVVNSAGANGSPNTGGGGAAAHTNVNTFRIGGNGGSGIVIVRILG